MIKKAVLPVAGLGTRMLPATKAIPKEMLPIVDKPLIQYVVNECVDAGIKEIVLVTHSSKNSIENHFDTSYELEATLEKRVKRQLLEEVQSIVPKDVTIMHVRQGSAKGLGHAILCARPMVGDSPFAVVLPDVIIDDVAADPTKDNLSEMVRLFKNTGASQVMVEAVAQEDVESYGIADVGGHELNPGMSAPMTEIVEKPKVEDAPSNLAVVGRYILSAEIWEILAHTPPGAGDEIQLTDGIATLMKEQQANAYCIKGKSHDCGSKLGYMMANVELALRHPQFGNDFENFILQTSEDLKRNFD